MLPTKSLSFWPVLPLSIRSVIQSTSFHQLTRWMGTLSGSGTILGGADALVQQSSQVLISQSLYLERDPPNHSSALSHCDLLPKATLSLIHSSPFIC